MASNNLRIRNLAYMLIYNTNITDYKLQEKQLDTENFETLVDFLAYMICLDFRKLLEKGLMNKFNGRSIKTDRPRGNIDVAKSYRCGAIGSAELVCSIQRRDINTFYNSVIKAAIKVLIDAFSSNPIENYIKETSVMQLRYYLDILNDAKDLRDIDTISYDNLDNIPDDYCRIYPISVTIIKNLSPLINNHAGKFSMYSTSKKNHSIYESFVRNLLADHFSRIAGIEALGRGESHKLQGKEADDNEYPYRYYGQLSLQPDCVIVDHNRKRVLLIDTKWYDTRADLTLKEYRKIKSTASNECKSSIDIQDVYNVDELGGGIEDRDRLDDISEPVKDNDINDKTKTKGSKQTKEIVYRNDIHGEIGKSCLYAMAYRTDVKYTGYDICTLVLMAKNFKDIAEISKDKTVQPTFKDTAHRIAYYRPPDEAINFQIAVVHHSVDKSFDELKKDIVRLAERFLSDDPIRYR